MSGLSLDSLTLYEASGLAIDASAVLRATGIPSALLTRSISVAYRSIESRLAWNSTMTERRRDARLDRAPLGRNLTGFRLDGGSAFTSSLRPHPATYEVRCLEQLAARSRESPKPRGVQRRVLF